MIAKRYLATMFLKKSGEDKSNDESQEDADKKRPTKRTSSADPPVDVTKKRLRSSLNSDATDGSIIMKITLSKDEPEKTEIVASPGREKLRRRSTHNASTQESPQRVTRTASQHRETPETDATRKSKKKSLSAEQITRARYEGLTPNADGNYYPFCWHCLKNGCDVFCGTCPRAFHKKCTNSAKDDPDWTCQVCHAYFEAESSSTRADAPLSHAQLGNLLTFAVERMRKVPQSDFFWDQPDEKKYPDYKRFVHYDMNIEHLLKQIREANYGSTTSFMMDANWLVHNSTVYNGATGPLTGVARMLIKVLKQEIQEIDNCPECYYNAHTFSDWFTHVCKKPHLLIWARLKGFPFWPAKIMSVNVKGQMVDARFFGAHDKAWVPVKECFLLSESPPCPTGKKHSQDMEDALDEMDRHVQIIKKKFGGFAYMPDKSPFDPNETDISLTRMIPGWQPEADVDRSRISVTEIIADDGNKSLADSPEDEVIRNLEKLDKGQNDASDKAPRSDLATDDSEDNDERSVAPEHGYSILGSKEKAKKSKEAAKDKEVPKDKEMSKDKEMTKDMEMTKEKEVSKDREMTKDKETSKDKEVSKDKETRKDKKMAEDKESELDEGRAEPESSEKVTEPPAAVPERPIEIPDDPPASENSSTIEATSSTPSSPLAESPASPPTDKASGPRDPPVPSPDPSPDPLPDPPPGQKTPVRNESPRKSRQSENGPDELLPAGEFCQVKMEADDSLPMTDIATLSSHLGLAPRKQPMVQLMDIDRLGLRGRGIGSDSPHKENSVHEMNRNLRLSDEVSLHVVAGEKRDADTTTNGAPRPRPGPNRARKSIRSKTNMKPNAVTISTSSSDVSSTSRTQSPSMNVISIDTQNSDAQKSMLKSLCTDDRNKQPPDDSGKGSGVKDNVYHGKTISVVPGSAPFSISPNYPTLITGLNTQNLALAQDNMGQLNLVQLANLTSNINPKFVTLTNNALSLPGQVGAVYTPTTCPPLASISDPVTQKVIISTCAPTVTSNCYRPETTKRPEGVPKPGLISVKNPASMGIAPTSSESPSPSVASSSSSVDVSRHSAMIAEVVQRSIEEIIGNLATSGNAEAKVKTLELTIERLRSKHIQDTIELKKKHELDLIELRKSLAAGHKQEMQDYRQQMDKVVADTKRKQWCAQCGKEALFYCCWNTSYCDYPCQQNHWPGHMQSCAQLNNPPPVVKRPHISLNNPATIVRHPTLDYRSSSPRQNNEPTYTFTTQFGPLRRK